METENPLAFLEGVTCEDCGQPAIKCLTDWTCDDDTSTAEVVYLPAPPYRYAGAPIPRTFGNPRTVIELHNDPRVTFEEVLAAVGTSR